MSQSVLQFLGLPDGFGYVLLVLALVLSLAPWLHGHDFGVIKIPSFSEPQRRRLQQVGPAAFLLAIGLHVPFLAVAPGGAMPSDPADALQDRTDAIRPTGADNARSDSPSDTAVPETIIFAEYRDGGCLYPVRLLSRDGPDAQVHFQFDERAVIPASRIFTTKDPDFGIGEGLFAKLPARDGWLPVTVRDTRTNLVQVTRDDTAACAAEFGKATQWVPRSSVTGIAPMGDAP